MQFKNNSQQYGLTSKCLHFISIIVIIILWSIGWYMSDLDYYHIWYHLLPSWHYVLGFLVLMLMVVRLFWLIKSPKPKPLETHAIWEVRLAQAVHWLMYLALLLLCISGYFNASGKGDAIVLFDKLTLPAVVDLTDTVWLIIVEKSHVFLAYTIVALFLFHVLGALKHHFIDKDRTLKRMFNIRRN